MTLCRIRIAGDLEKRNERPGAGLNSRVVDVGIALCTKKPWQAPGLKSG